MRRTKSANLILYKAALLIFFLFGVTLGYSPNLFAQFDSLKADVGFYTSTNTAGFDEKIPFWLHANRLGIIDQTSANALTYFDITYPVIDNEALLLDVGALGVARASDYESSHLNQFYARLNYKFLWLKAGRFPDPIGMNYTPLSMGSMMVSKNATPIPRVVLETDGFQNIPFTNGYAEYNASFSHGWMENDRFVDDVYLHQKYLYLKLNYQRFEAHGGIVHNVQWGGTSPRNGSLPSSFEDFIRVVLALGANEDSDAPGGEKSNTLGNSVAAYDFALDINLNKYELRLYRMFYLEDRVSTRFRSPWDGVWGAALTFQENRYLDALLYEHMNTKRQDSFDFEPRGTANYYNNGIYRTGWTYYHRVLGNPMILMDVSDNNWPVYNNIIIAHHIGAKGQYPDLVDYKFYYTFSRNYGQESDQIIERLEPGNPIRAELRPLSELKKVNHSFLLSTEWQIPNMEKFKFMGELALDAGNLYDSTLRLGIGLGVKYRITDDSTQ